jgi:hypothetical protein
MTGRNLSKFLVGWPNLCLLGSMRVLYFRNRMISLTQLQLQNFNISDRCTFTWIVDYASYCYHVIYGGKHEINCVNPLLKKINDHISSETFFKEKRVAMSILYAKDKKDRISIKVAEAVLISLG